VRVIIVGAGEVGYQLAKFLAHEELEVIVIEKDKSKIRRIGEELDIAVIEGEGGDPSALKEAEADKADMLLAVTNSDETNMIACLLAKAMFKIPRKVARIRNPDYFFNKAILSKENLDIEPAINPELEVAKAVTRLLEIPFATEVIDFEEGSIKVIGVKLTRDVPFIGKSLKSLGASMRKHLLVGIIQRGEKAIIPTGDDVVAEGDILYVPLRRERVADAAETLSLSAKPVRKVMILGGGRTGYYIASAMEHKADIKIIEKNADRCSYLSQYLGKSLILHGDGTDQQLLAEENIGDIEVFVAVTNNEELNIMASILAKKLGAKKSIAIVNKTDYIPLAHSLGLQAVLSPRLITASTILRYIRRGEILSLTAVAEDRAEIIEARVGPRSNLAGRLIKDARLPRSSLIGTIVRGDEIIIPSGTSQIIAGDKLIFFTLRESLKEIEHLLV